jgi:hypothetical protein
VCVWCVCVCVCMYVCMCVCVCVCVRCVCMVYVYSVSVSVHICLCMYVVCMCVCTVECKCLQRPEVLHPLTIQVLLHPPVRVTTQLTPIFFFFFFFQDRVSLYSPGCPGTHFVDQAGLELRNLPASQVLGSKACTTTAWPLQFL